MLDKHLRVCLVALATLASPSLRAAPQDLKCPDGYQPYGGRCVSQHMADYISCVEASGGNQEMLIDEISKVDGGKRSGGVNAELHPPRARVGIGVGVVISKAGEQSIARRLEQRWQSNGASMSECRKALSTTSPETVTPKKTGPDAARAELQSMGIAWGGDRFIGAIVDGDTRAVELFLRGGMSPTLNYKGASAVVYALQADANNRLAVLDAFLKAGFNPNQLLADGRIMRGYDLLPPDFSETHAPPGYEAWRKQFAGPADLWIVIRASYAGPAGDDLAQIRRLGARGADFKYSLAYLREYEKALGDTPVYWEVRNEVERAAKLPVTSRSRR